MSDLKVGDTVMFKEAVARVSLYFPEIQHIIDEVVAIIPVSSLYPKENVVLSQELFWGDDKIWPSEWLIKIDLTPLQRAFYLSKYE